MPADIFDDVDEYIAKKIVNPDPSLDSALEEQKRQGLPGINVSPAQGKMLGMMVSITGAGRILEIGTLGGYSSIWMASALPADGRLTSLEASDKHAEVAGNNIKRAGLSEKVNIIVGKAEDSLEKLISGGEGPYDLIFIDADKVNNPLYFRKALQLSRPGTVIIVDNVVRGGKIINGDLEEPSIAGTRKLYDEVSSTSGVDATTIQTVGMKGHDGFMIIRVR